MKKVRVYEEITYNMYSGARWIQDEFKTEMSPLGKAVANLLGRVFRGIYHLSTTALKKVDWTGNYCIEFVFNGDLATVDFSSLTELVLFGHDEMIRICIYGVGPGYMKMQFHQRKSRTGGMSERYPTIEEHIKKLRTIEKAA